MKRSRKKKVLEYKLYFLVFILLFSAVLFLFRNSPVVDQRDVVDCSGIDSTSCVFRTLYYTHDKSICSQITDENSRGICEGNTLEVNPCKLLSLGGYSDSVYSECVYNSSISTGNFDFCINAQDRSCLESLYSKYGLFDCSGDLFCELTLASVSGDVSQCTSDFCIFLYSKESNNVNYCLDIKNSSLRFSCVDNMVQSADECMLFDDSLRVLNCFKDYNFTCEDSTSVVDCEDFIKTKTAEALEGQSEVNKFVILISTTSVFKKDLVCSAMIDPAARELCYSTRFVKDPCDDESFDSTSIPTYDYLCNAKYLNLVTFDEICADFESHSVMSSKDCLDVVRTFQK